MMIRKTLLFSLLMPIIATSLCTSCVSKTQEHFLKTIEMKLPITSISIEENETYMSEPIDVKCFDNFGQTTKSNVEFALTTDDGSILPSWIYINKHNQIEIKGGSTPLTAYFKIFAYDTKSHTVHSKTECFSVKIHKKTLIPPDKIKIKCDKQKHLVFFGHDGNISMDVEVIKDGESSEFICNECNWKISKIIGPKQDGDLFYLSNENKLCHLFVKKDIDSQYRGSYSVDISAASILNPQATDSITLVIELEDGLSYTDEKKGYGFTRNNFNDCWTLSRLRSDTTVIDNVPEEIYGMPVTHVADRLCTSCCISKLCVLILPKSILTIGNDAFANQSYLLTAKMPGVKYVGSNAFSGCFNVKFDVGSHPTLIYVGDRAFYDCNKLKIDSKNNLYYIGKEAFAKTDIDIIDIGSNINYIGLEAFSNCPNLRTIKIENNEPPKIGGALYLGSTNPDMIQIPLFSLKNYLNDQSWNVYIDKLIEVD